MLRIALIIVAGAYTLLGIAALVVGFIIPWDDDPLAAVYAIMLGAPWVQLVGRLDLFPHDAVGINIALVTGSIVLNASLLWLWALTRRRGSRAICG